MALLVSPLNESFPVIAARCRDLAREDAVEDRGVHLQVDVRWAMATYRDRRDVAIDQAQVEIEGEVAGVGCMVTSARPWQRPLCQDRSPRRW